ncbi:MAG: hypothetical protein J5982_06325 [Bacilli bacterium]|nr:hypothetical protein [Bacilli bacterium]
MKKLYLTLLILNNIASIVLIIMFSNSLILDILFTILFIIMTILIIKRKKSVDLIDLITLSIYMIFVISMFIFSIVFQTSNTKTFSMVYFSEFLIIPNLLVNIYNLFN